MTLMDLVATLKMDVSGFLSGSREAKAEAAALKNSISEAGGSFGYTREEIEKVNNAISDFSGKLAGVGAIMTAGVTVPMVELASAALELGSSFQQAEIAFTTMLKSGTQAQQFLSELKDFAASTPFEFPDLQQAAQRLQAMGLEAKATIPIMTAIGDAVAGLGGGKDLINRITLALGEMNEAGTVSKREMNMLTKAGIDAWGSLAAAIGKSVPEAMDMVHKKMIDSATAIPAILEGIEERMGGMMQNQMRTIAGQWSNLQDQISFILADIGKALAPFAGMVMDAAAPVLKFIKDITEGFKNLPEGIQAAIVTLGALATAVGPAVLAFAGFSLAVAKVGELLGVAGLGGIIAELAPILIPLAAAILAAGLAWEAWKLEPVQNAVKSVWDTLQNFWTSTLQPVVETVMAAGVAFATFAGNIIGSGLQAAWEGLQSIGQTLMTVVSSLADALAPLWAAFTNVLDSLSPLLQPIEDLIGFLGKMIVALVEAGLIVGWEALKVVLGAVWEATSALATLIGGSFMTILGGMANMVKEVSQVWDALFKPALQAAVDALRAFLGVVAQIPGIKQAIDGVNSLFGEMKEKVVGAVEGARESVKGWGEDTRTSMAKAKEALDAAQKAYADVTEKAKEGKASQEQIKTATENLARAQSDYRAELERVKPRQEELTRAFHNAQAEYDASEANLRKVQKAFEDGKASAGDLASAQTRVNDASVGLKKAQSDLNDITKQTGVTMKDYSGSVDSVRASLQAHNQHAQTAKEAQAALKAEVETARQAFVKAFESYRTGTADVAAVQAAYENLQNAQDNLHPEKAAEAFIKAREDERKKSEENLAWYETTYLPKIAQMAEQEQQQILKLQETYFKAYQAMQSKAKEQIVIDVKLTDRLPEEVQAMIEFTNSVAQAYKTLGITSTQALKDHAEQAKIAYNTIKNSGIASADDILLAEKVALEAQVRAQASAGQEITTEQKNRLAELNRQLTTDLSTSRTIWDQYAKDIKQAVIASGNDVAVAWGEIADSIARAGDRLNKDLAKAFVDLFEGKGWGSFKDAGVRALETIAEKVIEVGINAIEKWLINKLKEVFANGGILDGLTAAFKSFGSYVLDLFKEIGSTIVDGVKAAIGWITNAVSGGTSAAGSAAGAAGSVAGAAGSTAGSVGSVTSGIASGVSGVVTAVASVASAVTGVIGVIQGMHQSADLGRIEENTRFTQIGIVGNGGLVQMADVYWPKLEGMERFNYDVLAPILSEISDNQIGKLDHIYYALVVDLKNEIIGVKNQFHDLLFSNLDNGTHLGDMSLLLTTISGSLDDIKVLLLGIGQSSAQAASASEQSYRSQAQQSTSIMSLANSVAALGPSISAAIQSMDIRGSIAGALANVGATISNAIMAVDVRSTIQGAFNNLSASFSGLSSAVISASSMRTTMPTSNVYLTVNNQAPAMTSNLAALLRSYGVTI